MVTPIIPGLSEQEIAKILDSSARADCSNEWHCEFIGERPRRKLSVEAVFARLCRYASERYFGASEAAIASNRGFPRSGSQSGCSRK